MKKTIFITTLVILMCGSILSGGSVKNAEKGKLMIGWGSRSLATDKPVPITGQFHLRVSMGVFKPVIVSALAIENGSDAVIFVSADIISLNHDVFKMIKRNLAAEIKGFPVDKVIINATHTHAGPANRPIDSGYPNDVKHTPIEELQQFTARQITDAVKEAWEKRAPGSIAYGYGFATTGHSRRVLYMDDISKRSAGKAQAGIAMNGHCKMYGSTRDDMFDGFEAGGDSFINLLYTFDKDGKLNGAIINVPCPAQTSESVWMLHASFWNNVREKLTEKYGNIGVITQSAGAGDMSPRQLYYNRAERRRYKLKYADKIAEYRKNPLRYPDSWVSNPESRRKIENKDIMEMMRAEDIANRIVAAFDEVLSWAQKEKLSNPKLKHKVRKVKVARRLFPQELVNEEKAKFEAAMKESFVQGGEEYRKLFKNSRLASRRRRIDGISKRAEIQEKSPFVTTTIHAVRIGNLAFASNRFELFIDYMHRIQARSPFEQTFVIQLTADDDGTGSYLATERAVKNKGYSATPYCNQVSPKGGKQLVDSTISLLRKIRK